MNCRDTETLLLAERDGVLTKSQHAELADHLATCPDCLQFRAALTESALFLKAETANTPTPDIETEWQAVRARLSPRDGAASKITRGKKRPLAPLIWFGAPLAAAAALVVALIHPTPNTASRGGDALSASYSETDATSTMVYVDQESGWLVVWASDSQTQG